MSDANNNGVSIPDMFSGVRLGSVVSANGHVSSVQAFDLERLGRVVSVDSAEASQITIFGNSTYSRDASATAWMASIDAEYSGLFTVGGSAFLSNSFANANDDKDIQIGAMFAGTNRIAHINFGALEPEAFFSYLSGSLRKEKSPLGRIADCIGKLEALAGEDVGPSLLNDKNAKSIIAKLIRAKRQFKDNYGVGFVSGVVLGGAASIQGQFDKQSQSNMDRWQGGGSLSGGGGGFRGKVSASYGNQNEEALRNARFEVNASSFGGKEYSDFARKYAEKFGDKMGEEIWKEDVATPPSTSDLLGSHKPDLPDVKKKEPKKIAKLADQFGKIKNSEQLALFNQALAFDRWNKKEGGGKSWDDFEAFQRASVEDVEGSIDDDLILFDDSDEDWLYDEYDSESFSDSDVLFRRVDRASTASASVASASAATPADMRLTASNSVEGSAVAKLKGGGSEDSFNNEYWAGLKESYAVTGLEITRWEDVIAGLGYAESLLQGLRAGQEVMRINRLVNVLERISNMYALAASTMTDDDSKNNFLALSNTFRQHIFEIQATLKKGLDGNQGDQASAVDLAKQYLRDMDKQSRQIYMVFLLNQDLFTLGEVGMGAYIIFQNGGSQRYMRIEDAVEPVPDDITDYRIFKAGLREAKNSTLDLRSATHYAQAMKFFPVLDPEIKDYVADGRLDPKTKRRLPTYTAKVMIMVSSPKLNQNSAMASAVMTIMANKYEWIKRVPLERFKVIEVEGAKEVVMSYSSEDGMIPELMNSRTDSKLFSFYQEGSQVYDKTRSDYSVIHAIYPHIHTGQWGVDGTYGYRAKTLHLVPFKAKQLRSIMNWKGFLIYERVTELQMANFRANLTVNIERRLDGYNYWQEAFGDDDIDLEEPFSPMYLRKFRSYVGLVPRPKSWEEG